MIDLILHALFGIFIGICIVLMVDGYFSIKERRRRFDEEADKYLQPPAA